MNRHLITVIIIVLVAVISSATYAQYESSDKSPIGIKASLYRPSASQLSDMKSMWISPTIQYNTMFDENDRPSLVLSFSWFNEEQGYTKGKVLPLTATYIKRYGEDPNRSFYLGAGTGIYVAKYQSVNNSGWVDSKGTKLGLNLVGGVEFGTSMYAELRYDLVPSISGTAGDIDFSGLTLSIGTHTAY